MWCEIRVRGYLDGSWSTWFDGLTVTNVEPHESKLAGAVQDQAALHGVLLKIRDLGMPLVTVTCIERVQHDVLPVDSPSSMERLDHSQRSPKDLDSPPAGTGGDEDG